MSKRDVWFGGVGSAAITLVLAACSFVDLSGFAGAPTAAPDGAAADGPAPVVEGGAESSAPADAYAAAVLEDQPVAYYRFDDEPGATQAADAIAGRSAILTNGTMSFGAAGIAGGAVSCSGSSASLEVGDVLDFAGTVPFSFEVWLRRAPTDGDQIIINKRKENPDPRRGYILYLEPAGDPHFEAWGADLSAWADPIPNEVFTHVVLTVTYADGTGNAKLWINAQPQPSGGFDNVKPLADTDQPLRLLAYYKGLADELAIYDKALPAGRILAHYQAGKPR